MQARRRVGRETVNVVQRVDKEQQLGELRTHAHQMGTHTPDGTHQMQGGACAGSDGIGGMAGRHAVQRVPMTMCDTARQPD